MFLSVRSFVALISILIFVLGCDSNKDNPKDYWVLNEPQLLVWDTSSEASARGFTKSVSEFSPEDIKESLDYKSYIEFKDLEPNIEFEINSSCKKQDGTDDSVHSKKSKLTKSKHIYLYNFLPDEVLYDESSNNELSFYVCDFAIKAINSIDSKHSFALNGLKINTFVGNELNLDAVGADTKSSDRSILFNKKENALPLPNVYINDRAFVFRTDNSRMKILAPAYVKCAGENNKFDLSFYEGELISSDLKEALMKTLPEGSTTFLKKCRLFSMIAPQQVGEPGFEYPKKWAWSDYFNIIFDGPKIGLEIEQIDTTDFYPFNDGDFKERQTHIFNIKFTNQSKKKIRINLPSDQTIPAVINPIVYNIQKPEFKPKKSHNWQGFAMFQSLEEFNTELYFLYEGQRVIDLALEPGEEKIINLYIDKNFKCNFKPIAHNETHPTAERGFRLRAIGESMDKLKVEYLNQGVLEVFPIDFSWNNLFTNSNNSTTSTKNIDGKQKAYKTNYLQRNMSRDGAIDTLVLRSTADINFKKVTPTFGMYPVITGLEKGLYPPNYGYYESQNTFCEQVY